MSSSDPLVMPGSAPADVLDGKACVYYDGACPLCRAEIASYQRTEGGDTLRWVDASSGSVAALGPDLDRATALTRLHVRRADGTLLRGAAAFAEIWASLPRWRWLAHIARFPGMTPCLDVASSAFLRARPLWRRPPSGGDGLAAPHLPPADPRAVQRVGTGARLSPRRGAATAPADTALHLGCLQATGGTCNES